jgi:hypothetical protein
MRYKAAFKLFLLGIFSVAVLDVIGSLASRRLAFNYGYLTPVSLIIYIFVSHFIWKASNIKIAIIYAALIGMFDGSVGLLLSINLHAFMGSVKMIASPELILVMAVIMSFFGAAIGAVTVGVSSEYFSNRPTK